METQKKTLGIIHAVNLTIRAMQPFLEKFIPDIEVVHLCDDSHHWQGITFEPAWAWSRKRTTSSSRSTRTNCMKRERT